MPIQSTLGALKSFKIGEFDNNIYYFVNLRANLPVTRLSNSKINYSNVNDNTLYILTDLSNNQFAITDVQEQKNNDPTVIFNQSYTVSGKNNALGSSFDIDIASSETHFFTSSNVSIVGSGLNYAVFAANGAYVKNQFIACEAIRANTPNANIPTRYNPLATILESNNSVTVYFQDVDYTSNVGTNTAYYAGLVNFSNTTVNAFKQLIAANSTSFSIQYFHQDSNNDYIMNDIYNLVKVESNLNSILWAKTYNVLPTTITSDSNNNIYIGSQSNNIIKLDSNGNVLFAKTSNIGNVAYALLADDDKLYCNADDGNIVCLDATNGNINWARSITFTPNVNANTITIGNIHIDNQTLYVFGYYSNRNTVSNTSQVNTFCAALPSDGTILGNGNYSIGSGRYMNYNVCNISFSNANITVSNANVTMRNGNTFTFTSGSIANTANAPGNIISGIPW